MNKQLNGQPVSSGPPAWGFDMRLTISQCNNISVQKSHTEPIGLIIWHNYNKEQMGDLKEIVSFQGIGLIWHNIENTGEPL